MFDASRNRSPLAPVALARSLPAKSTRHILLVRELLETRWQLGGLYEVKTPLFHAKIDMVTFTRSSRDPLFHDSCAWLVLLEVSYPPSRASIGMVPVDN